MLGYFDDKNREYIIKNMFPRRPLVNYLWNEKTVCSCDQFGEGFCWGLPDINRRMIDSGIRNIYVKERKSGKVFTRRERKRQASYICDAVVAVLSRRRNLSSCGCERDRLCFFCRCVYNRASRHDSRGQFPRQERD